MLPFSHCNGLEMKTVDYVIIDFEDNTESSQILADWCTQTIGPRGENWNLTFTLNSANVYRAGVFEFSKEEYATLFKLKWL